MPTTPYTWTSTRKTALHQLTTFLPTAGKSYTDKRNYDHGAGNHNFVSMLSLWLRHRVISEQEVVSAVLAEHSAKSAEKYIQEVFWRSYWKGWLEMRPQVWGQYQQDLLRYYSDEKYLSEVEQVVHHGSGIECFDHWTQELVNTGYLHNHARMWYASIWIFTLQLPWQLGADFFLQNLLDGDPASNTLSWRWVAGLQTKGKAYAASADNINKFTNGRFYPTGQLNENIEALTEEIIFEKYDLPEFITVVPSGRVGRILHEDDLHSQRFEGSADFQSVVSLQSSDLLSPGNVNERVSAFTRQCIESAAIDQNLQLHSVLSCTNTEDIQQAVALISQWAIEEKLDAVVWAYAPAGSAASVLSDVAESLRSIGVACNPIQRHWDSIVWPHAGKGFFALKKKIPELLIGLFPQDGV